MKKLLVAIIALLSLNGHAQDLVTETFSDTRIINGHSTETLKKRIMQYRIEHRFGDAAGVNGGVQNWFGFDNAADIRMAVEYGISDKLMIGVGRSKGAGAPYRSLVDGFLKYKLLSQTKDGKMPISMSLLGTSSITYMKASEDVNSITHFPKTAHRMAYSTQLIVARKFGDRVSMALMPTYVHTNYVAQTDVNDLFAVGGAINVKLSKATGIIVEYYHDFHDDDFRQDNTNSLAVAFEWITNGHNFHLNLSNSRGFGETQFIPYTFSSWMKGQFRIGFSISRDFKI